MTTHVYPARAAERVLFRELFENPEKVHRNGGTIVGGAVPKNGLPLDGTTQYATWPISGLAVPELTFVLEFVPDFATSEDVQRYLFSTDGSNTHRVIKMENANNNALRVYMGGTLLATIAEAAYSPYWNVGEVNRLIVAAKSANTDVWLNGQQIVTAAATAFATHIATDLYAGADWLGANKFDGEIKSLSVLKGKLTQEDVNAIETNSLYTYQNDAALWLDMRTATRKLRDQLYDDPDMEAVGTTSWTATGDGALSKSTDSPYEGTQALRLTYVSTADPYLYQAGKVFNEGLYWVEGWYRGDGSGTVPRISTGSGVVLSTAADTGAWQHFSHVATPTTNNLFRFYCIGTGWVEYDLVSVRLFAHGTIDKSPNGVYCLLANGYTSTSIPDFLNPGFDLNGTSDYLWLDNGAIFNHPELTIVQLLRPRFADDGINHYMLDTETAARYYLIKNSADSIQFACNGTFLIQATTAAWLPYWRRGGVNVLVGAAKSGDNDLWLNGRSIGSSATAWAAAETDYAILGAYYLRTENWFDGEYLGFFVFPFKLSPLQIRDFTFALGVNV